VLKIVRIRRSHSILMVALTVAAAVGIRCGTEKGVGPEIPYYGVTPDSVEVGISSTQQFSVEFATVPSEVTWYVDGVRGGTPRTGMITPEGLYIAPHEVPADGYVTITAEAILETPVRETAKAVIRSGYGTPFIEVDPDSITAILGDSTSFSVASSGCALTDPSWSVVAVSSISYPAGEMRANGTYIAPTTIPGDDTLMVTVESPDCPGKMGIARAVILKPATFVVQFEDFSDSSGVAISRAVECHGGAIAVNGLDHPGEWITVPYEARAGGEYAAEIHYQSGEGDSYRMVVTEIGCPNTSVPQEVDFIIDQGDGFR
jgi:hypothetical protein